MRLEEFWETTPGEVSVFIYAADESRLDRLELGVHEYWLGRAVSYSKEQDPNRVLPPRRHPRGGRQARRRRVVDQMLTQSETRRWQKRFKEQAVHRAADNAASPRGDA